MESFVIVAGENGKTGCLVCTVRAIGPKQAHGMAADNYRKQFNRPTNTHVNTRSVFRSPDHAEAETFHNSYILLLESQGIT